MSAILSLATLTACEKNDYDRPNVMLISVESLRADHVGAYGYSRNITPNIDRLAREGVMFENVVSQSSWTKPSVASTFTSTYQSVHQVRNPRESQGGTGDKPRELPGLKETLPTISGFFSSNGYKCYGWTNNKHLWGRYGFERGFAIYDAAAGEDREIAERVKGVLQSDSEPWFVFVHLMSPHFEYDPPPEYRNYDRYPDAVSITPSNWTKICNMEIPFSERDLRHNIALYDGEIAYTDRLIGRLMDKLEKQGLKERTIVVISADHGEEFLEHGKVAHGTSLHRELIRVPLVFSGPRLRKSGKVAELAQNIDIFPTLARLCGLEPPPTLQGIDLSAAARGKHHKVTRKFVFSELGDMHAISGKRFKYIFDENSGTEELYDLIEDPAERNNLARVEFYSGLKSKLAARLAGRLRENAELSEKMGGARRVKTPRYVIRDLKSLGYLQ